MNYIIGGISGSLATLIIMPIDTFKVLIQCRSQQISLLRAKGPLQTISYKGLVRQILEKKGFFALYRGLSSAIVRQLLYASTRLGTYSHLKQTYFKHRQPAFYQKIILAIISGFAGAFIGNPYDVMLIRTQALMLKQQKATSLPKMIASLVKQEGVKGLMKGIEVTLVRVAMVNIGQLACFDQIQLVTKKFIEGYQSQLLFSALVSSIITSFITLPFDNIKVKIQKDRPGFEIYKGYADCFNRTIKNQGFIKLWVGLPVFFMRGAPHSMLVIVFQKLLQEALVKNE